jgi:hypothetical protein
VGLVSRTPGCINKSFKLLNEEPLPKQVAACASGSQDTEQTTAPNAKRRCAAETSVNQQLDMQIIMLEIARTSDWRPRVIYAFNVNCSRQAFPEPLGVGAQDSVRQIACLGILLYSQVLRFITGRICFAKTVLI